MEQFCPIYHTDPQYINTPGQNNLLRLFRDINDNEYYVKKSDGTIELFCPGGTASITAGVIPQGTGSGIADGTWHFEGNNLVPNVTGSNIGSDSLRVGTIFMDSDIDYSSDLELISGGNQNFIFTTGGAFGVGVMPNAPIHVHGFGPNDSTANMILENSLGVTIFEIFDGASVDMGFNSGGNFGSVGIGIPHVGTSRLTVRGITNNNTTYSLKSTDINDLLHFGVRDDGHIFMPNLPLAAAGLVAGELWNNAGVVNII